MKRSTSVGGLLVAWLAVLSLAGCGSDGDDAAKSDTTEPNAADTAAAAAETTSTQGDAASDDTQRLNVLVTNDDGVGAPGIDALVNALRERTDVKVTVIAPEENQSGTGGSSLATPLTTRTTQTASGTPAVAVAGFPADTVVWAIDQGGMAVRPDLVISGINLGQNIGPLIELSGTVGAARAAGARGIPALATSLGIGDPMQWEAAVNTTMQWLDENLRDIAADDHKAPGPVWNLNIPNCAAPRGIVVVAPATGANGRNAVEANCSSTSAEPVDDIDALINGLASLSQLAKT